MPSVISNVGSTRGRRPGLSNNEWWGTVWLSVWSEMRMICHCYPMLLASLKFIN